MSSKPWKKSNPVIALKSGTTLLSTLDLDALFGYMPFDVFSRSFKSNLSLEIDNSSRRVYGKANSIKTKCMISDSESSAKYVSSLPHVRLGTSNSTQFGILDLYFFIVESDYTDSEIKSIVFEEVKLKMKEMGLSAASCIFSKSSKIEKKHSDDIASEEISCVLSPIHLFQIISTLFERLKNSKPMLYFETFGNKKDTISNSLDFNNIKEKISSCFDQSAFKYINVDVCISVSSGLGTVTLAKQSLFKDLHLCPNFSPLFTDTILNCHQSSVDRHTGEPLQSGIFKDVAKVNFYSTFIYNFNFDKSPNYVYPLSGALMLNNFYGYRIYSNSDKFSDLFNSYNSIEEKAVDNITQGTCMYRAELRCNLLSAEINLNILKKHLIVKNFAFYDSKNFFELLQINISKFTECIKTGGILAESKTPDSLAYSFLSEYIFKTLYIRGSSPINILSKNQNDLIIQKLTTSHECLAVFTNIKDVIDEVFNLMSSEEKMNLLLHQVKFIFQTNGYQRHLLSELIKMCYNTEELNIELNMIKTTLKTYVVEKTGLIDTDIEILKTSCQSDESVGSISALTRLFHHPNTKVKATIAKIYFHMLRTSFNSTVQESIKKISKYMMENKINTIFKFKSLNNNERISLNFDDSTVPILQAEVKSNEKKTLFNDFEAKYPKNCYSLLAPDDDELVRYIHSLFRHRKSYKRIFDVHTDFTYGLFPVRNEHFIKNKLQQLNTLILTRGCDEDSNRDFFLDFIRKVKEWSPEKFNDNQRSLYFEQHGIKLDSDLRSMHDRLVFIDNQKFWESNIVSEIARASAYDIFYGAVLNARPYVSIRDMISTWSAIPINFVLPTEPETKPTLDESSSETIVEFQDAFDDYNAVDIKNLQVVKNKLPQDLISCISNNTTFSSITPEINISNKYVVIEDDDLIDNSILYRNSLPQDLLSCIKPKKIISSSMIPEIYVSEDNDDIVVVEDNINDDIVVVEDNINDDIVVIDDNINDDIVGIKNKINEEKASSTHDNYFEPEFGIDDTPYSSFNNILDRAPTPNEKLKLNFFISSVSAIFNSTIPNKEMGNTEDLNDNNRLSDNLKKIKIEHEIVSKDMNEIPSLLLKDDKIVLGKKLLLRYRKRKFNFKKLSSESNNITVPKIKDAIVIHQNNIVTVPKINSEIIIHDDVADENEEQVYISKLFKKYGFTEFNGRQSLTSCFNFKNRPASDDWNSFLAKQVSNNILSSEKIGQKTIYRFINRDNS